MESSKQWIPNAAPFFLFGVVYYLLIPSVVLQGSIDNNVLRAAREFVKPDFFDAYYYLDVLLITSSWLSGYFLLNALVPRGGSLLDAAASYKWKSFVLLVFFGMLLAFTVMEAVALGAVFFTGYESYDVRVLGPFATLVFLSALFFNYFQPSGIRVGFLALFGAASLLMLSIGSRMFFVLGFISITIGWLSKSRAARLKLLLLLSIAGVFVVGVGVWRSSSTQIDGYALGANFLAEPVLTLVSGAVYLENSGGRPWLGMPTDIAASVVNFVPSAIYPEKIDLLNELTFDENKFSPFGANSIIVNLYSNFGFFYPFYLFLVGGIVGALRSKAGGSVFYRAVYFSLLPLLMFYVFREGFVTVIKVVVFNGFIVPVIVVALLLMRFPVEAPAYERK